MINFIDPGGNSAAKYTMCRQTRQSAMTVHIVQTHFKKYTVYRQDTVKKKKEKG